MLRMDYRADKPLLSGQGNTIIVSQFPVGDTAIILTVMSASNCLSRCERPERMHLAGVIVHPPGGRKAENPPAFLPSRLPGSATSPM
jgi:hypothetical protein